MIRKLDLQTIRQVAAGQVIQNPSCIIKELIENSIDAGATEINIEIRNNNFIKVSDNGIGMCREDLEVCTESHTTSKFDSLDKITTLGFRGEALNAIKMVSHLQIITKKYEGYKWENNHINITPANNGTTIIVENLFINMPARAKFLRPITEENNACAEIVDAYALCYENIKFKFKKNNKTKYYTINRLKDVLGTDQSTFININYEKDNIKISGQILYGLINTKNYIFVNNRYVKNKKITQVVRNVYQKETNVSNISFILNIKCDYEMVDVNINPAKDDVRFNNNIIFEVIAKSIIHAMNVEKFTNTLILEEQSYNQKSEQILLYEEDKYQVLGQVWNTYIIIFNKTEMIMIDQHAAAERIMYEQLKSSVSVMTYLLYPIQSPISNESIDKLKNIDCTNLIEYHIKNNVLNITAYNCLLDERKLISTILHLRHNDFLYDYACRNSIKAGDMLNILDCKAIVNSLMKIDNAAICNHGRPIYLKYNKSTINHNFCRC